MAHAIERELIKVTSYKPRNKFDDRQDYLSSILNAVMKLSDDDFDNLTDEAAAWANKAVEAHNSKDDIPDFDEVEASEDDGDDTTEDGDDGDIDDSSSNESDADTDDVADSDDDPDDDEDDDEPEEDDPSDDEDEPDEDEPDPAPKKKPKTAAAAKGGKGAGKGVGKPAPSVKAAKPAPKRKPADDDDVVLDKWGCMQGSKNGRALSMFEKGATAKEVKEELGGTYYNILKKMVQDGHTIEKEGAIIKLIHKDEKGKKPAPKAPAKKGKK